MRLTKPPPLPKSTRTAQLIAQLMARLMAQLQTRLLRQLMPNYRLTVSTAPRSWSSS